MRKLFFLFVFILYLFSVSLADTYSLYDEDGVNVVSLSAFGSKNVGFEYFDDKTILTIYNVSDDDVIKFAEYLDTLNLKYTNWETQNGAGVSNLFINNHEIHLVWDRFIKKIVLTYGKDLKCISVIENGNNVTQLSNFFTKEEWICLVCGEKNDSNYCEKCGKPKSYVKFGDCVKFGYYEQDNNTTNGKEDIEWLVLDIEQDKILVISKYALECKSYNLDKNSVTWETCDLREWLNSTFIDEAFSSDEQNRILSTTITADRNPAFKNWSPGNDTVDKVFILSIPEVHKYFGSAIERVCEGTEYCYKHGAYKNFYGNCQWWLRTPGNGNFFVTYVYVNGEVKNIGTDNDKTNFAVRPAMWIKLGI